MTASGTVTLATVDCSGVGEDSWCTALFCSLFRRLRSARIRVWARFVAMAARKASVSAAGSNCALATRPASMPSIRCRSRSAVTSAGSSAKEPDPAAVRETGTPSREAPRLISSRPRRSRVTLNGSDTPPEELLSSVTATSSAGGWTGVLSRSIRDAVREEISRLAKLKRKVRRKIKFKI